jgi:hypothetical protein
MAMPPPMAWQSDLGALPPPQPAPAWGQLPAAGPSLAETAVTVERTLQHDNSRGTDLGELLLLDGGQPASYAAQPAGVREPRLPSSLACPGPPRAAR